MILLRPGAGLKGVTALAQAVDVEVLSDLLTRAATLMQDEVQRLEGCVTRCIGEHLVALFSASMAQEDHVVRALHAARGIQRVLVAYADELRHTHAMTLDLAIGVHTGTVGLGTLASRRAWTTPPRVLPSTWPSVCRRWLQGERSILARQCGNRRLAFSALRTAVP